MTRLLPALIVALLSTRCGASERAGELGEAERAQVRAAASRLRAGMTRSEVFRILAVPLDRLAQMTTGPETETTTIYVLGGNEALYLTWDASRPEPVLLHEQIMRTGSFLHPRSSRGRSQRRSRARVPRRVVGGRLAVLTPKKAASILDWLARERIVP